MGTNVNGHGISSIGGTALCIRFLGAFDTSLLDVPLTCDDRVRVIYGRESAAYGSNAVNWRYTSRWPTASR